MSLIKIAEESDFDDRDRILVTVDATEIGVIHVGGEFHALQNVCPHQYGPVAEGELQEKIVAEVPSTGERVEKVYQKDRWIIRCPCHAWGFDIDTGENVADPNNVPSVQVYDTVVKNGDVYVDI